MKCPYVYWAKKESGGGSGQGEEEQGSLTLALWLRALKRGCEERLWQEITLEGAAPSEKPEVLLPENSFSKGEYDSPVSLNFIYVMASIKHTSALVIRNC